LYNAEHLKSLGATHVIDRYSDFAAGINEVFNGRPVEVVYDSAHFPTSQNEVDLLSPGGVLVTVAEIPRELVLAEGRRVAYVWGSVHLWKDAGGEMYKVLGRFLEEGTIKVSTCTCRWLIECIC
jgi:NADPH:quinone reductase-like Zn-dependent oxidoreductase